MDKTDATLNLPLLSGIPAIPANAVMRTRQPSRQKQINAVFEKADKATFFKYRCVLVQYGTTHADFIAGDVTESFETSVFKLDARHKKALGGLYQRLIAEGVIEKTGEYRKRDQGNMTAVYRLNR